MVKLVIKLLDSGKSETFIGSEKDAEQRLRVLFPRETEHTGRLMSCISAINAEGFGEVDVAPYMPPPERNLLPKDYDADVHREDPWPRSE
jgi:hypothetical protein